MKKKLGAIIMAGVMACTMTAGLALTAGCGKTTVQPDFVMPEGGFDTSKGVTIKFYHTMNQDLRKVLQSYITKFNVLYPNIEVKEEAVGGYDDVRDQINTEIIAGDQPNIAYCYPDHVALFNESDAVQSLNGFLPDGEYKNMTVKRVKTDAKGDAVKDENGNLVYEDVSLGLTQEEKDMFIDGYYDEGFKFGDESQMYTLPFSKSTEVMFYNKTFFEQNNLKVPETWDEMETVCARILEIDAARGKEETVPLGYDSEANWFITMCEQYGSGYTSSSGNHFLFDNSTNRGFVERFKDWRNKGYFTTQTLNKGYTSSLFTTQQCYMCIGSSAGAKNQSPDRVQGEYPFEVGIASIPQLKQTTNPAGANYDANYKAKVISQGPSVCIFRQKDPQQVLASWLFVKYLTTNIDFQARFSSTSGYVPVLKMEQMQKNKTYADFMADANGYDNLNYLSALRCMEQEDAYYTSPAFMGSSKARDQVGALMQAVFAGSKTIDEAFKYAIRECEYAAKG
ncbi:MAG: extracellular solute-binding protein [Clostridia bacterium]|nr:extracellular solute-binding protein [Clostridia bacterium]